MGYHETKQHGTKDFPYELYKISESHPRYEMAFHFHASIELIRVRSGRLQLSLDGRKYTGRRGDVFLVNSEVVHGATPESCAYDCLVFHPAILRNENTAYSLFLDGLLAREFLFAEEIRDAEAKKLVREMMRAIDEKESGYVFTVMGLTGQLFGLLQEKGLYTHKDREERDAQRLHRLKRVLRYMRDNFSAELSLDKMAEVAGLSTKYFCAFFKQMTGTTPTRYLLTYRVERAARRLLSTDQSVTEIAYDCGFNDLSYFIKAFKEIKGVTPKSYRRQ